MIRSFLQALLLIALTINVLFAASISEIAPIFGPAAGGNSVIIKGTGFTGATVVKFGNTNVTSYVVDSDTQITAVAPPAGPGTVDISVTAPSGASLLTPADLYTYQGSWVAYATIGLVGSPSTAIVPIDLGTNTASAPVLLASAGDAASGVQFTPDGQTAYVLNSNISTLTPVAVGSNTIGTPISFPIGLKSSIGTVAISPDGTTAYANPRGDIVYPINLSSQSAGVPIVFTPDFFVWDNVVSPDGQTLYVAISSTPIELVAVDISSGTRTTFTPTDRLFALTFLPNGNALYIANGTADSVTPFNVLTNTILSPIAAGNNPFTIAGSPNGESVYVGNQAATFTIIDTASNSALSKPAPASSDEVAVTPDGKRVYFGSTSDGTIFPYDVSSDSFLAAIPVGTETWPFLFGLAISPDQAPRARFTLPSSTSFTTTLFDASNSLSPTGTIASYEWNFGDGSPIVTTTSPIVPHIYSIPGTYPVTLRVTNSAGTSTTQVYTGHAIDRNGGPLATITQNLSVGLPPPSDFDGVIKKNKFLDRNEFALKATWQPSPDPTVTFYRIYKKNVLVAVIPAGAPRIFKTYLPCEKSASQFEIAAVNSSNIESARIKLEVIHD